MNPPLRRATDACGPSRGHRRRHDRLRRHRPRPARPPREGVRVRDRPVRRRGPRTRSLPLMLTNLVATGKMSWQRLVEVMCVNPRKVARLAPVRVEAGSVADLTLIDPDAGSQVCTPRLFAGKQHNSAFMGAKLRLRDRHGRCRQARPSRRQARLSSSSCPAPAGPRGPRGLRPPPARQGPRWPSRHRKRKERHGNTHPMARASMTSPFAKNVPVAEGVMRLTIEAPRLAAAIRPGQFMSFAVPGDTTPATASRCRSPAPMPRPEPSPPSTPSWGRARAASPPCSPATPPPSSAPAATAGRSRPAPSACWS